MYICKPYIIHCDFENKHFLIILIGCIRFNENKYNIIILIPKYIYRVLSIYILYDIL